MNIVKLLKVSLVTLLSSQMVFAAGTPPGSPPPAGLTQRQVDRARARLRIAEYREQGEIGDDICTFEQAARYLREIVDASSISTSKVWGKLLEKARFTLARWRAERLVDDTFMTATDAVTALRDESAYRGETDHSMTMHESQMALALARLRINGEVGDDLITLDQAAQHLNTVETGHPSTGCNERKAAARKLKERLERLRVGRAADEQDKTIVRPHPPLSLAEIENLLGLTSSKVPSPQLFADAVAPELAFFQITPAEAIKLLMQIRSAPDPCFYYDDVIRILDARLDGSLGDDIVTFGELGLYLNRIFRVPFSSQHKDSALLRLAQLRHWELVGDEVITREDAREELSKVIQADGNRQATTNQRFKATLLKRCMNRHDNRLSPDILLLGLSDIDPRLDEEARFISELESFESSSSNLSVTTNSIQNRFISFELVFTIKRILREAGKQLTHGDLKIFASYFREIAARHAHIPSLSNMATELADCIERLLTLNGEFADRDLNTAYELGSLLIDKQINHKFASEYLRTFLDLIDGKNLKTALGAKSFVLGLKVFGAPSTRPGRKSALKKLQQIILHHGVKSEVAVEACRGMAIILRNQTTEVTNRLDVVDLIRFLRRVIPDHGANTVDGAWARLELFRFHNNEYLEAESNQPHPYDLTRTDRLSDAQLEFELKQVIEKSSLPEQKAKAQEYLKLHGTSVRDRLKRFSRDLKQGNRDVAFRLAYIYDTGIHRDDLPEGFIDFMMKLSKRTDSLSNFWNKAELRPFLAFVRAHLANGNISEAERAELLSCLLTDAAFSRSRDKTICAECERLLALLSQVTGEVQPDESSSSSSGRSDSGSEPEQKKARRTGNLIKKPYRWGQKYLPGERATAKPFLEGTVDNAEWLKTPDLTFVRLQNLVSTSLPVKDPVNAVGMSATYLTERGLYWLVTRTTFVFPGRMENALIPVEQDGGRIVLVVPSEHEAEAQKWVSPHVDVLVVHSIDGVKEEELKLLTARRLAAFIFAKHQQLPNFFTLDDNVQHLYGRFKTWAELYAHFLETAESNDATCLSGRTFRPEEDTDGRPSGEWKADMDDVGSKFFFFRGAALYKFLDLHKLLPHRMRLCAEDLWMQVMLRAHELGVGAVNRKAFVFTRSKKYTSICKKTVGLADEWLSEDLKQEFAAFNDPLVTQTFEAVAEEALRNIEADERRKAGRADADLGQEAYDVAQKKKDKLAMRDQSKGRAIDLTKGSEVGEPDEKKQKKKHKSKQLDANALEKLDKDAGTGLSRRRELVRLVKEFVQKHAGKDAAFNHQLEALQALTEEALGDENAAFGVSATGTGKTTEFLMLIALAMQSDLFKSKNIALAAPRLNLVGQHYEEIEEFNKRFEGLLHIDPKKVVKIGSGNHNQEEIEKNKLMKGGGHLAIFCDRSLKNFLLNEKANDKGKEEADEAAAELTKRADLFSLILIDELHTMPNDMLQYVLAFSKKKGALTIGFTATPGSKGKLFRKKPAFVFTSNKGVEGGFLCPWINDEIDMEYSREHFNALVPYAAEILKKFPHPKGGLLVDKSTFIFVPSIEDAQKVALALQKAGIKAEPVHSPKKLADGTILKSDPDGAIRRFQAGETKVLVAVEMLTLGTDVKVDFVWLMTDELDEAEYIQRRGRALRGGRRNDKAPAPEEGVFRAPDSKIAYILSWKNALPKSDEHACPHLKDYALSPDYMGLFEEERHFGPFRIKPCFGEAPPDVMEENDDDVSVYGENAGAFQEDIDTQRANLESIREMMRAQSHGHGREFQVRIRPTPADGDCGFHATDIPRADYIRSVVEYYKGKGRGDEGFMQLMDDAMMLLGVNTIDEWAREYARKVDGQAVHYLDATNMRIMTLLYNFRIFIYTVDGERGQTFVPLQGEDGFIFEGRDYRNARDVHLAWINLEPLHSNGPLVLNHFERMLTIRDPGFYHNVIDCAFAGLEDVLEEERAGTTMQLQHFVASFTAAALLGLTLQIQKMK